MPVGAGISLDKARPQLLTFLFRPFIFLRFFKEF